MNVAFGNEFILPTAEKTGYSFAFWRGPDGTAYSAGQKVAMPADNMEFRAVWLLQSRKVTFIIGNDTISFDVIPGQKIPMPDMSAYENVEILYWLDNNGKKKTLDEIGNSYGVSRERIRQIENRAIAKLKKLCRNHQNVGGNLKNYI